MTLQTIMLEAFDNPDDIKFDERLTHEHDAKLIGYCLAKHGHPRPLSLSNPNKSIWSLNDDYRIVIQGSDLRNTHLVLFNGKDKGQVLKPDF